MVAVLEKRLKKHSKPMSATYKGKTLTLKQWAKELGIPHTVLYTRKSKGWSDRKVLTYVYKPATEIKTITHKGKTRTCKEWAAITGMDSEVIRSRYFHYGWSKHKTFNDPVRTRRKKSV